jgi:hypothetical protein
VVDDPHKPYGLTSLARCDLSQVHKVQHKPRKNSVRGHNLFGAKRTWVFWFLAHRTLSGAPGPYNSKPATLGNSRAASAIIHRTVRCAAGLFGEPAEQRLPVRQRSSDAMNSACQKSEGTGLSGAARRQTSPTVNCSKP